MAEQRGGPRRSGPTTAGGVCASSPDALVGTEVSIARRLAETPERRFISLDDGVRIAYRVWELGVTNPGVAGTAVLIHGNAARIEWWDAIAPTLSARRVVAVDLSGHGESDWREDYDFEDWTAEVIAVLDAEDVHGAVDLVGHSMGGLVALSVAWADPTRAASVTLVDTPFRRFTPEEQFKREAIARKPLPRYQTLEEAVAGFKVTPPLRRRQTEVWDHLARTSYRHEGGNWVLHFDPSLFRRLTRVDDFLRPFPANTFLLRAEHGLVTDARLEEMLLWMAGDACVCEVPGLGHNLLLEDPVGVGELIAGRLGRLDPERREHP